MSPELAAFLASHGQVVTTAEASALGVNRETLRSLVRAGVLTRVARGAYVLTSALAAMDHESGRHLLAARAILRSRPGAWAASHATAAVVWGLPVLERTLDRIHVVHAMPVGSVRRHDAFTVHRCPGTAYLIERAGVPTVTPEVAVVGVALLGPLVSAVMAMDAALRGGFCTRTSLEDAVGRAAHVAGVGRARRALAAADPTAESPGESWLRVILQALGYGVVAQHPLRDEQGLIGYVDFYLPELGVVVEFDGRVKYQGRLGDGLSPSDAVLAERARERRIRKLGYGVARVVWAELFDQEKVRREVDLAARTARRDLIARHERARGGRR
ncbi:type IV toxin-antitoxin system AbiEi family antitoxin domain-containing protein [Ornithinimicrobium sufpigmenti]|uniref:type IV toxin-antitoxin system AbiEi family antitoxin domain-containing protein n=1 Tax=Ornithinimicrobium sufpigmenti TaxID=2508882 RepID=UPI0010365EB6|nr:MULTISPECIES: type IV toxin-antitoxin system AbiEi family antitoxin domain-containing protein [unclassified Ornithinimicrobium]